MALPMLAHYCRLAGRSARSLSSTHGGPRTTSTQQQQARRSISTTTGNELQFRLDERTAHSSLDLYKRDTGVIYRMLGLDPSKVQHNPERFIDWAVVLGDQRVGAGRHYWEVTVKKSREFRLGVAEALMSREDCVGTSASSWVFGYAPRPGWFAMTKNKTVPVALVGKPERVGILLDVEAGEVALVDVAAPRVIHTIRTGPGGFREPLCPAFGLWDGELLTHSGLEEPQGLK